MTIEEKTQERLSADSIAHLDFRQYVPNLHILKLLMALIKSSYCREIRNSALGDAK